jgi:hypothetical protein
MINEYKLKVKLTKGGVGQHTVKRNGKSLSQKKIGARDPEGTVSNSWYTMNKQSHHTSFKLTNRRRSYRNTGDTRIKRMETVKAS